MRSHLRTAIGMVAVWTILAGLAYPLLVTVLAGAAFPEQAGGSLITDGEAAVGSILIGQPFDDPGYFWGRPSATTPEYNAAASGASNWGPLNPKLQARVTARAGAVTVGDAGGPIPADLVTASGSGLDPHITPAAARYQVPRVAKARGLEESVVSALVERYRERRQLGILGEPRVNVLRLNLALDRLADARQSTRS
jgi:K+-transporting ATPase ATPase C chain